MMAHFGEVSPHHASFKVTTETKRDTDQGHKSDRALGNRDAAAGYRDSAVFSMN